MTNCHRVGGSPNASVDGRRKRAIGLTPRHRPSWECVLSGACWQKLVNMCEGVVTPPGGEIMANKTLGLMARLL